MIPRGPCRWQTRHPNAPSSQRALCLALFALVAPRALAAFDAETSRWIRECQGLDS